VAVSRRSIQRAQKLLKLMRKGLETLYGFSCWLSEILFKIEQGQDTERVNTCELCAKCVKHGQWGMGMHYLDKHPESKYFPQLSRSQIEGRELRDGLREIAQRLASIEQLLPQIERKKPKRKLPKNVIKLSSHKKQNSQVSGPAVREETNECPSVPLRTEL